MKAKSAILFADLHASNKYLDKIKEIIVEKKPVVILFAGDVVNMGDPIWYAEKFIKVIDGLNIPLLWVPGNNDFGRAYHKVQAKFKSLEGRIVEIDLDEGISRLENPMARDEGLHVLRFTGVGGSPASWAGQYEGEKSVDKKAIAGSIFLSHVPPPGLLTLMKYDDQACGSHSERSEESRNAGILRSAQDDIINRPKRRFSDAPLIHICAHVHWQWGVGYLGETKVIKLASAETGHYAMMNLENLKVEFKEIR